MIKHIVLLTWKEGVTQKQVDEVSVAFGELPQAIPEIASYRFGRDAGIYKGNADYALVAEFNTEAALESYVKHSYHQQLMTNITGPMIESFQSIQFIDEA